MNNTVLAPLEWSTQKRQVKSLIPYEYNPRRLTDDKKEKLRASLEKFNLAEIPAINTDDIIIAGHQRVLILMEIGRGDEYIDVRVPNRTLTEEEFKQYNISSNVQTGEWDLDILNEIFNDIDLEALGLNVADIPLPENNLPQELQSEEEEEFDPEPPKEAISKTGDIYEFRSIQKKLKHRVICGDSTIEQTYSLLLGDEFIDLEITDPPYNVNYTGDKEKPRDKIKNDSMNDDSFYQFLFNFYSCCLKFMKPGSSIYVFHADTQGVNFRKAFIDSGFKYSQCLIWNKSHLILSRNDYHWKHEPCLYGWKLGASHNWYNDRKQSTVIDFQRPTKSEDHPTMKPLDLFTYLIKNSSKQLDIVSDSFSGSGTTLICCEQNWRQARVIELDPSYVDVNVKRYIKYMRDNHLEFEVYKNEVLLSKTELDQYLN